MRLLLTIYWNWKVYKKVKFIFKKLDMEILMVRPYQFYFNQQTAANNFFQSNINIEHANELAIAEFDTMVEQLRAHQIKLNVVQDT